MFGRGWGLLDLPRHRNEPHRDDVLLRDPPVRILLEDLELLKEAAYGNDHPAVRRELVEQWLRDALRSGSDDDPVEGGVFGPAAVAVAFLHGDVAEAEPGEALGGLLRELRDDLDRVDVPRELREHGALVARARADLQDALVRRQVEQLAHERNDVRLRDRLPAADGKRAVLVGVSALGFVDEEMPRHSPHRIEHTGISNAARHDLRLDHLRAGGVVRLHGSGGHGRLPGFGRAAGAGGQRRRRRRGGEEGRKQGWSGTAAPQPVSPDAVPRPHATRPPTSVSTTGIDGTFAAGTAIGSAASTVRSASNPGAIRPRRFSSNEAQAASDVKSASASARERRSDGRHPPGGLPDGSWRV